jgi:hypothetical protein
MDVEERYSWRGEVERPRSAFALGRERRSRYQVDVGFVIDETRSSGVRRNTDQRWNIQSSVEGEHEGDRGVQQRQTPSTKRRSTEADKRQFRGELLALSPHSSRTGDRTTTHQT